MGLFGKKKKLKIPGWMQSPEAYYQRVFAPLETAEREASARDIEQQGYTTDAARRAALAQMQQNLESRGVFAGGMQGGVAERMGLAGERMKNIFGQAEQDRIARMIGALRAQGGSKVADIMLQYKMAKYAGGKKRGGLGGLLGGLLGGIGGFALGNPFAGAEIGYGIGSGF